MKLTAEFKPVALSVAINTAETTVSVGVPVVKEYVDAPAFSGPYEITPDDEAQSFETTGKRFTRDLTVNAIDPDFVGSNVPRRTV